MTGVSYSCDKCDYNGITQGSLNIHIQSTHKGVKYSKHMLGSRDYALQHGTSSGGGESEAAYGLQHPPGGLWVPHFCQ